MKVKVGDTIYDGNIEPVMVILTTQDRVNIGCMSPQSQLYASAPDGHFKTENDMLAWMKETQPKLKIVKKEKKE